MGYFYFRSAKGQTLIEVLAAFGIAVLLVSAITVTVIFTLLTAQFSKNQNLATQYAQQGIETIRQMRNAGIPLVEGVQCFPVGGTTILTPPGYCLNTAGSSFRREVTITNNDASCDGAQKVVLVVSWSDSKCMGTGRDLFCHSATLTSCLSNFGRVPTP